MNYKPKCPCGLTKIDGMCPEGCERFARPARRAMSLAKTLRRREERVGLDLLGHREASAGIERVFGPRREDSVAGQINQRRKG